MAQSKLERTKGCRKKNECGSPNLCERQSTNLQGQRCPPQPSLCLVDWARDLPLTMLLGRFGSKKVSITRSSADQQILCLLLGRKPRSVPHLPALLNCSPRHRRPPKRSRRGCVPLRQLYLPQRFLIRLALAAGDCGFGLYLLASQSDGLKRDQKSSQARSWAERQLAAAERVPPSVP